MNKFVIKQVKAIIKKIEYLNILFSSGIIKIAKF